MTVDPENPLTQDADALNAQASVLMKRGIRLLAETDVNAWLEALECFDRALEMRLRLPVDLVPLFGYGLAACWLNRADILVRLGGAVRLEAALQSYDEGIAVLRRLPFGQDARYPRRLAIAHQNRGLALQAQGSESGVMDAIAAFSDAIEVLDQDEAAAIPDRQYLRAVTWLNLANARAQRPTSEASALARDAALRAIAFVSDLERADPDAAEVGLKARHVLCQAAARRLAPAEASGEAMADDVHLATDAADEGLSLARHWEQQGVGRFRTIAYDMFRFGARVYAIYQPQFLQEFVHDNLDPERSSREYVGSAEMRAAAEEVKKLL